MPGNEKKRMTVGVTPAAAVILKTLDDGYKTIFVSQAVQEYAKSVAGKYLLKSWKREEIT